MDERKMALLSQIIKQHIKTASPISSKLLASMSRFNVSPATIRNEMAELEEEGYITHPHTSAGRLPTEKGYHFYLENLIKSSELLEIEQRTLKEYFNNLKGQELELMIKNLAKKLVVYSNNTVVVGFSPDNVYYTGVANLFTQPEFCHPNGIYNISLLVDHLDKVMAEIFDEVNEVEVKVGSENPFSNNTSVVLTPWQLKNRHGILGILGPLRMDYEHNLGLAKFINQLI